MAVQQHEQPGGTDGQDQETAAVQMLFRGGLKGRFSTEFCTLQSAVDALECCLQAGDSDSAREQAGLLLAEMNRSISRLERLAENTADLAMAGRVAALEPFATEEMRHYLADFCACANEELALRGASARVILLQQPDGELVWVKTSLSTVDSLLANLLSNSLRTDLAAQITLTLTPDRCLEYTDGALWPAAACGVLCGGAPAPELAANGSTGLLLIRQYANSLGWTLEVSEPQAGGKTVVRFRLPPCQVCENDLVFRSSRHARTPRAARLRMELDGTLA